MRGPKDSNRRLGCPPGARLAPRLRGELTIPARAVALALLVATCTLGQLQAGGVDRLKSHTDGNVYMGSETCKACHAAAYESWKRTLHSRMYQSPDQPSSIRGDFDSPSTIRSFSKAAVKGVIGSRWEQMYYTEIAGDDYVLPAKWLIELKRWEPYHPDDWKTRPMRSSCHGCHAVAQDPVTGQNAEVNIGCEACHGPGGDHVAARGNGPIVRSVDSDVCGRCHSRGESRDGLADFAYTYVPGTMRLRSAFDFNDRSEGQQGQPAWWEDGSERDRHQEYSAHQSSRHATALLHLRQLGRDNDPDCLSCHSTSYRLRGDDESAMRFGITCAECHTPHPRGEKTLVSRCETCHKPTVTRWGDRHWPCPDGAVSCIDCHMPETIRTAGMFNLRSHRMKIIPPSTASQGQPSSCQNGGCHAGWTLATAIEKFDSYRPDAEKRLPGCLRFVPTSSTAR